MNGPISPAIRLDNLTLGYDRHPAVHHLSCDIAGGALVAIVGPNGAGKSTLLKALVGELAPLQGSFQLGNGRGAVAYLPQQSELDRSFPVGVFDMVAMGLWHEIGAFRGLTREQARRVEAAIAAVGLSGFESRQIGALSGGQLQRARFARMMLQNAPVLLLDEPFNAVDARTTEDLVALLLRWHAEGRTILAVLHNLDLVRKYFPDCLLLARELVAFGKTADVLTPEQLAAARRLAAELDPAAGVCRRGPEAEFA